MFCLSLYFHGILSKYICIISVRGIAVGICGEDVVDVIVGTTLFIVDDAEYEGGGHPLG